MKKENIKIYRVNGLSMVFAGRGTVELKEKLFVIKVEHGRIYSDRWEKIENKTMYFRQKNYVVEF